ncbi:hypothetical protein [Roseiconus lacunae]|uniref:Uncharacterized protein n=1 Tax=Roseiconus lacunae TaxID=2605694 RepID=A0ABT7PDM2_9BACT|nr:hypothetical protein [Roseiconus lacunae]MDM4014583.1 hypothetical protein [Roseiconus lacunae]
MSLLQKFAVVALVVAISQGITSSANANPLEKLFANAGRKVVGGVSKTVQSNVKQSTRLILKTAPYALLQGNRTQGARTNLSGSTLGSGTKFGASNISNKFVPSKGSKNNTWQKTLQRSMPSRRSMSFRPSFRR